MMEFKSSKESNFNLNVSCDCGRISPQSNEGCIVSGIVSHVLSCNKPFHGQYTTFIADVGTIAATYYIHREEYLENPAALLSRFGVDGYLIDLDYPNMRMSNPEETILVICHVYAYLLDNKLIESTRGNVIIDVPRGKLTNFLDSVHPRIAEVGIEYLRKDFLNTFALMRDVFNVSTFNSVPLDHLLMTAPYTPVSGRDTHILLWLYRLANKPQVDSCNQWYRKIGTELQILDEYVTTLEAWNYIFEVKSLVSLINSAGLKISVEGATLEDLLREHPQFPQDSDKVIYTNWHIAGDPKAVDNRFPRK